MAKRGSEEWRRNISKGIGPKVRKASSLRHKRYWKDPKFRAKLLAAVRRRGVNGPYAGLDRSLLQHFKGMHDRVRDGKAPSIKWPRTREGYIAFMHHIGPKPDQERKWSVGRKDHKKGYQPGNVKWQDYYENSSDRPY